MSESGRSKYGAAFEQGTHPDDTLIDQPVEIRLDNGMVWRPSDADAPRAAHRRRPGGEDRA